ncbi:MAG: PAS domain S-box protein [Acidobacteriota bacterium]
MVIQVREELVALFELAPVAMLVLDRERRVVLANAAAARLAGRSHPEDLAGLVAGEAMNCIHRLDDPRGCGWGPVCAGCPLGTTVAETLARGVGRHGVEGGLPWAGGEGRTRRLRISTAFAVVHGSPRVLAFLEDVTAHHLAEEALRASEEKYRQLVEDINDVIYTTDAEGVLTFVSSASLRVMGYPAEELMGRHFSVIVYPDDLPALERRFREVLQQRLGPWEFRYRHASGEIRWARTLSTPVQEGGVSVGLRGVLSDITETRRVHEQLVASQRMEALGQLAGGLAHDMNNILQAMTSTLSLAKLEPCSEERSVARLKELEAYIKRGAGLTRQLLLFARRETARPELLDLNRVVEELLPMLRRLLRENVSLEVALAGEELPVEADRGQLEQVLTNLAVNAVDAMPDGGLLRVTTGAAGGEVWLAVADTGTGIPEELQQRIFEPFFTTKEAGYGTGIGLAVVHGIATGLGGRVEVASAVGRGSRFTVSLPRARAQAKTPSGELPAVRDPADTRGRGEHILLVEDEEDIRGALADVLSGLGYRVTAVGSVGEAGVLDESLAPDVLLTDLVLPDASGVDLAASLLERWPRMAVIMMSGYTSDEAVRLGAAAGLVRFLQKPFEIPRLAEELRAALDERR